MMVDGRRFRQGLVLLICLGLSSYFIYHLYNGNLGLEARVRLQTRERLLLAEHKRLETVDARLARDVALLEDNAIDPDMASELAARLLNFYQPGQFVLRLPEAE